MTAATLGCQFCIDGHMPAGRDDHLGELFERCPACSVECQSCNGLAVFPANYNSPLELVVDLLAFRLGPAFCPGCLGVIALVSLGPRGPLGPGEGIQL
ncbi:hypothetical protein AB0M20_07945 [Actinoplanes sp. NPDC051633]|uniref:hypothetical protein n=1 Tax=Actinoplanes sp. NPDC051633 TaxID=3155670 RepID=UPI003427E329